MYIEPTVQLPALLAQSSKLIISAHIVSVCNALCVNNTRYDISCKSAPKTLEKFRMYISVHWLIYLERAMEINIRIFHKMLQITGRLCLVNGGGLSKIRPELVNK